MQKEIRFGGYSTTPSDYDSRDGELASSLGLVNEDEALRPIAPPVVIDTFGSGVSVVFIHSSQTGYTHFILYDTATHQLKWASQGGSPALIEAVPGLVKVDAVGNTLIALSSSGISYYLWSDEETRYKPLGNAIPDIPISFGLVAHPRGFDGDTTFNIALNQDIATYPWNTELTDESKRRITQEVMSRADKLIADESTNKGRFCMPFFVRYAVRLYDDSLVNHSAPILMIPTTDEGVVVFYDILQGTNTLSCLMMSVPSSLDYCIQRSMSSLSGNWSDIIKSVDIFVSKPIYTHDQSGTIESLGNSLADTSIFVGRIPHNKYNGSTPVFVTSREDDCILDPVSSSDNYRFLQEYSEWTYKQLVKMYFIRSGVDNNGIIRLPERSKESISEEMSSCSVFFKLASIPFNEIAQDAGTRKALEVPDDYLPSLVAMEAMVDDYLTHDKLTAGGSYVYNSRLNLFGVSRSLFSGFSPFAMLCYTTSVIHFGYASGSSTTINPTIVSGSSSKMFAEVYIKEGGVTRKVSATTTDVMAKYVSVTDGASTTKVSRGAYVFYPNTNAFKMTIYHSASGSYTQAYDIDLKPHDLLNGAYGLLEFNIERTPNHTATTASSNTSVDVPNKLYTSEVANPFYFPVEGIKTIGAGSILGIATAAKALSQGQFGKFPLYAFATDGVWALEVSSSGFFNPAQPITLDVCTNAGSIAQMDSSVLFVTSRGLMMISGSNVTCLTDNIDGDPFDVSGLPLYSSIDALVDLPATAPFLTFLSGCGVSYVYDRQYIIVFNKLYDYAYVYSIKGKSWGMMRSQIDHSVNAYPASYVQLTDGTLVDYSQYGAISGTQFLLTRPLKLDAPDILKTIDVVIQRGLFASGGVKTILYGSRDLQHWFAVYTSDNHYLRGFRGTPYKYFRIALVCSLTEGESLSGMSVQFTPRLTDQPR